MLGLVRTIRTSRLPFSIPASAWPVLYLRRITFDFIFPYFSSSLMTAFSSTSNQLPGVLNVDFYSLSYSAAWYVAVKLDMIEAFFLKVKPSKIFGLEVPILLE